MSWLNTCQSSSTFSFFDILLSLLRNTRMTSLIILFVCFLISLSFLLGISLHIHNLYVLVQVLIFSFFFMTVASFPSLFLDTKGITGQRKSRSPVSLETTWWKDKVFAAEWGRRSMPLFLRRTNSQLEKLLPFDPDSDPAMTGGSAAIIIILWGFSILIRPCLNVFVIVSHMSRTLNPFSSRTQT